MGARIVIAEDDPKQSHLLRVYLEREGHGVQVVADGRSALDRCRAYRPDLVILDVMMPAVDGLDVCRILRAESDVAILMLTSRSTEDDILLGLDLGADDYITKPYSPRQLTARVRALLRRTGRPTNGANEPIRVGDLVIDNNRFEVHAKGHQVTLTAKEFAILAALAAEPGRVFTRAQIIDGAFGFDNHVEERTVDAHIMNLRRKIEDDPGRPRYIQTVYGRGYRLAEAL
ncbi:response regulator transcription factor [Micromonospora chersina]|uniref:response regulator transcription factor n=1 Tax=Micromonospora chersina TaxID=47854 RepID=UPI0037936F08